MFIATSFALFFNHNRIDYCLMGRDIRQSFKMISADSIDIKAFADDCADPEYLGDIIRGIIDKIKPRPDILYGVIPPWEGNNVRLSLPPAVGVYLKKAVNYEIERHIPWDMDQVYMAIDSISKTDNERINILCTVCLKERVDYYYKVMTCAGFPMTALVSSPFALHQSLDEFSDESMVMVINGFDNGCQILCLKDRELVHARYVSPDSLSNGVVGQPKRDISAFMAQLGWTSQPEIISSVKQDVLENYGFSCTEPVTFLNSPLRPEIGASKAALTGYLKEECNLLSLPMRKKVDKKSFWIAAAMGLITVVLAVVFILSGHFKQSSQLDAINKLISQKKKDAIYITKIIEENNLIQQQLDDLKSLLKIIPLPDILLELTQLIPTDTWLKELIWGKTNVTLIGFSPSASELLPLIESSPFFKDVTFASSIIKKGKLEEFRIKGVIVENKPE